MLKSNQEIQNFYDFSNKLGEYGIIKRAIRKITGEQFAMKIISKESISIEELLALRNMWTRLAQVKVSLSEIDHPNPNVIKLHEVCEDDKKCYLILELLIGETLYDHILNNNFLNEKEAAKTFRQIVEAIICCHCMGIVHGDLKLETLIFNSGKPEAQIKICDFGLARFVEVKLYYSSECGLPIYIAPESLNGKEYTQAIDYWSIGVILYIMLCGFPPFYDEDYNELFEQIKKGEFQFPSPYWDSKSNENQLLYYYKNSQRPNQEFIENKSFQKIKRRISAQALLAKQLSNQAKKQSQCLNDQRKYDLKLFIKLPDKKMRLFFIKIS